MKSAGGYSTRAGRTEAGFTLVELMVGLIIGLMLSGSLLAIVISNTSAYNVQMDHARVHENARFALEFMSRDIRMAGYFGCIDGSEKVINNLTAADGSLFDLPAALEGFENDGNVTSWAPSGADTSSLGVYPGSDAITIRFGNPTQAARLESASSPNSPLDAVDDGYRFLANAIAIVSDCDKADIFRITGVNDLNQLTHGPGADPESGGDGAAQPPANATGSLGGVLGDGYDQSATVMTLNAVRYFVRQRDPDSGDAGAPVGLYRQYVSDAGVLTTEEVVAGVENMQILYGVDTTGDRVANSYLAADDVGSWRNVVAVKLSILVRSNEEYGAGVDISSNSHSLLGTSVVDGDSLRVRRRQFSTTVELRNRL